MKTKKMTKAKSASPEKPTKTVTKVVTTPVAKPVTKPVAKQLTKPAKPTPTVKAKPPATPMSKKTPANKVSAKTPAVKPMTEQVVVSAKKALSKEVPVAAVPAADKTEQVAVKAVKAPKAPRTSAAVAEKINQMTQKWSALFKKSQTQEAKPYDMHAVYEERTPIVHKLLGWGYILTNRNDRLEVLFKDGIKYLISNYKS